MPSTYLLAGLAAVAVATGCGSESAEVGAGASTAPTVSTGSVSHEIDDSFAVGRDRHHLAMRCLGAGDPTIILEAGTDSSGIQLFGGLMGALSERTRTCTYDRVGTGRSDPPSEPRRTLDDVTADLHALLESARVDGPYVLAGSSGGALIALDYAGRYPKGIAAVVLLDGGGPNPNLDREFPGAKAWKNPEHIDWVDGERRLALHARSLGAIPLVVATASESGKEATKQAMWLKLSSRSRQTVVEGSHDFYLDNLPGAVAVIQSALPAQG